MEGGFSNDPSFHGGATHWGITAATLAHRCVHPVTEADVAFPPNKQVELAVTRTTLANAATYQTTTRAASHRLSMMARIHASVSI
jgi:hypothetical protein